MSKDNTQLESKWGPILDHADAPILESGFKRKVTAQLLENQLNESRKQGEALTEDSYGSTNATDTSLIGRYDPILISLVRRAMPNLIAYDVAGVQPMTGPTGLIFAMRPKYVELTEGVGAFKDDPIAFYDEADTAHSGDKTGTAHEGTAPSVLNPYTDAEGTEQNTNGVYTTGRAMETKAAEMLGTAQGEAFQEMGFEIDKMSVEAKTRALKAKYSVELAQDMKAIHGLDTEQELANILSTEILAEINRELIRTVYATAKPGAQANTQNAGIFDLNTDANGRWSVERFKGLMFQIERDANAIARQTRRGKGNFVICSSDVASALAMIGVLQHNPQMNNKLEVDETGNTFAGVLNGKYKVYIDPYAEEDYYVVGYKGPSHMDAGIYYAPYVPLQLYKAVDSESFQPKLGFKTRYGLCSAPFAYGREKGNGALEANKNVYFRRVGINNLM